MNTMNKIKLLPLIVTFIITDLVAQNENLIHKGDSLFEIKNYVDAKNVYEKLFFEKKVFTNSMLLKMSFIEEGLGNHDKALLFLSYHYNETFDEETLMKINAIAEKNQLSGFEQNDMIYFKNLFKKNKNKIYSFLLLIIVALISFNIQVFKTKTKLAKQNPYFILVTSIFFLLIINFSIIDKEGIISFENVFIMNGPSPGSDVYKILKKGSKIRIRNEENIWYQIDINDEKKYIRKKNVYLIEN